MPSSIDTSTTYYVISTVNGTDYALSAPLHGLYITAQPTDTLNASCQWRFTAVQNVGYPDWYQIGTVERSTGFGAEYEKPFTLSSANQVVSNIHMDLASISLAFYWGLDSWADGTYKLVNNGTGSSMPLGYVSTSAGIVANLTTGDDPSMHWKLSAVSGSMSATATATSSQPTAAAQGSTAVTTLTSTNSVGSTVLMTSTVVTTPSSSTPSSTGGDGSSSGSGLPTGAIAGIAIGGFLALAIVVIGLIWLLRRNRAGRAPPSGSAPSEVMSWQGGGTQDFADASKPQLVPAFQQFAQPQGSFTHVAASDAWSGVTHEVGGDATRPPTELGAGEHAAPAPAEAPGEPGRAHIARPFSVVSAVSSMGG